MNKPICLGVHTFDKLTIYLFTKEGEKGEKKKTKF